MDNVNAEHVAVRPRGVGPSPVIKTKRAGAGVGHLYTVAALAITLVACAVFELPAAAQAVTNGDEFTAQMVLDDGGNAILNDVQHEAVGPGLDLVSVDRISGDGRLQFDVLVADLDAGTMRADYVYPGKVAASSPLSEMLGEVGAVAGVNGSFFDINNSSAPNGLGISRGEGIVTFPDSAQAGASQSLIFTDSGTAALTEVLLEGSAIINDGASTVAISAINSWAVADGHIGLFTPQWGEHSRTRILGTSAGAEAWIDADGIVTKVTTDVGGGQIADGTQILVARGSQPVAAILDLVEGDHVEVSYGLSPNAANVVAALGSGQTLLTDGVVTGSSDVSVHPRSGAGFSADGTTLYLVAVDGRQDTSVGLTLTDFGQLMADIGAVDAVNLDGGGSTTLLARHAGDTATSLVHNPSDGYERSIPNGIGLFSASGSGVVAGYRVQAAQGVSETERLFPGLHRTLVAAGYDETFAPVASEPQWSVTGGITIDSAEGNRAVALGTATGVAAVTAASGTAVGARDLQVLGDLQRLTTSTGVVALAGQDAQGMLTVYGHDADGYEAAIDAVDVTVTGNDGDMLTIVPGTDSTFLLTAIGNSGSAQLTLDVAGESIEVAVTVGVEESLITPMDEIETWRTTGARSTSSVAPDDGREGGTSARLSYDFSQATATRTANALPPLGHPGFEIPGQPRLIKVWVKGTTSGGKNADTYIAYSDAAGSYKYLYGAAPAGNEWERLSYPVPEGTKYPISLRMVSAYETKGSQQYTGEMWFDDPTADIAPPVNLPVSDLVTDSVIGVDGATDDAAQRVAVMSDAQFVARNPDSDLVAGARRTLQEIVAADPDVLFINGDLVDEGSVEDFALAKRILDEELDGTTFPYYYIPGNHEIMGADIANFRSAFGDTSRVVDQNGTRFITLDSSTGRLSGDFTQVQLLRAQLDDAAVNPAISGVVVLQHMPIDDPLVNKASQLASRLDAEMEQDWLEDFREESGKSVALVSGHVGVFHASRENGISYLINGNSGKTPAGSSFGGFTGWTMLGIDPAAGAWQTADAAWLESEVQPHVNAVNVTTPSTTLESGARFDLDPVITQGGDRTVDVAWPMSYSWLGTAGVHVGAVGDAPTDATASVDPTTNLLTALRAGTGSVSLTVNSEVTSISFTTVGGTVGLIGDPTFGETLTADVSEWAGVENATAVTYQWLRAGEPIEGAVGSSYALGVDDVAVGISVRVSVAADSRETITSTSSESAPIAAAILAMAVPIVTGTAQVGSELSADAGEWTPVPVDLTYQWNADGQPILGATNAAYQPTVETIGFKLSVTVTGTKPGYAAQSQSSMATSAVAPADIVAPTLTVESVRIVAGDDLTVVGSDFTAGSQIKVWLHSKPVLLGRATVGTTGSFGLTVTVPLATMPGAHSLVVTDGVTGLEARVGLDVAPAVVTVPTEAGSVVPSDLASTGVDASFGVVGAMLLLLGGLVLVRRRKATARQS